MTKETLFESVLQESSSYFKKVHPVMLDENFLKNKTQIFKRYPSLDGRVLSESVFHADHDETRYKVFVLNKSWKQIFYGNYIIIDAQYPHIMTIMAKNTFASKYVESNQPGERGIYVL